MPELVSLIVLPESPWGTLMRSTGFVNRFCILHFAFWAGSAGILPASSDNKNIDTPAGCRRSQAKMQV
jgi:hypothetical protein